MTHLPTVTAELRKLLEEATPGPWQTWDEPVPAELFAYVYGPDGDQLAVVNVNLALDTDPAADAALIAAAVTSLPALLDVVEAAREMFAAEGRVMDPDDTDNTVDAFDAAYERLRALVSDPA